MIEKMTVNKKAGTVTLKISGKNFHKNLHMLCTVVPAEHRRYDGEFWHIVDGVKYAESFRDWWPEYAKQVDAWMSQLELPLA